MTDMREKSKDPKAPGRDCSDWTEIVKCLEEFPSPEVTNTEDGVTRTGWVFRGLADSRFDLEPAIERQARDKSMSWLALERLVAWEFKSRARMHLIASLVPDPQAELTWLAQMQHYATPTRLLDFTYSPFVALYFAWPLEPIGQSLNGRGASPSLRHLPSIPGLLVSRQCFWSIARRISVLASHSAK